MILNPLVAILLAHSYRPVLHMADACIVLDFLVEMERPLVFYS